MDFFQKQDEARKATKRLIVLYALAVLGTAATIGGVFQYYYSYQTNFDPNSQFGNFQIFWGVTVLISLIIFSVSIFKILQLGSGGAYVATMIGGTQVKEKTKDPKEKMYLNIVEEMSLASGIPRPRIFILESEDGINAFAAGTEIDNAAVCVSRGCLNVLSRDELQGVVAHEFSHIFNGDMKLNIKLIGYLAGLEALQHIGSALLRGRRSSYSSRRSKSEGNLAAIGLALYIPGLIGGFIANLLKSSISQQREFLADASAVQFTRNPEGIGGALKKIYASPNGSFINASRVNEISHMLLAKGLDKYFSTHPPLLDRIEEIFPSFNEKDFEKHEVPKLLKDMTSRSEDKKESKEDEESDDEADQLFLQSMAVAGAATQLLNPKTDVKGFLESLSPVIVESVHRPESVVLLAYALVHDSDFDYKKLGFSNEESAKYLEVVSDLNKVKKDSRLGLLDLCMPILKDLSSENKKNLLHNIKAIVKADNKVSTWEWFYYSYLKETLLKKDTFFDNHASHNEVSMACNHLFSYISKIENKNEADQQNYFHEGMNIAFSIKGKFQEKTSLSELNKSLKTIKRARPLVKQSILKGANHIALANNEVHHHEKEMIKLLAETMNIPMPVV